MESPAAIKELVRTHYGDAIRSSSDCCGGEAAASTYGCGNPFAAAGLQRGDYVLDLGSGAGADVLMAARIVGDEGRVYGLDMTDEMLEAAHRNVQAAGIRNVVFLRGDIEAIPLPSGSIDVVISNCVVNLTSDKGAAFVEAHRVLKRGGRLSITDIVVDGDLNGLPLTERQIRAGLSWAACVAGALTADELRATLDAVGFEHVEISVLTRYSRQRLERTMSPEITGLPGSVVDDLSGRFTTSLISAVKL
jgi:ubiquinone/menaquinone biosynthesis C-methylase UbiE